MQGEVDALSKRMENVRESISILADIAEARGSNEAQCDRNITEAKSNLNKMQMVRKTHIHFRLAFNKFPVLIQAVDNLPSDANPEDQLVALRTQLLALGRTEGQIKGLREHVVDSTSTTESSIIDVLEIWQQIFRDTFQKYHRLSLRLVQSEDSASALRLWRDYLMHVQAFLSDGLPDDYSSLNEHRHLCEVHQNLLTSQQSVLSLPPSGVDPVLAEQVDALSSLHSQTLTRISDRHAEIEQRLNAWDAYKTEQARLLQWLKERERERSRLPLRYIHLRRVDYVLRAIDDLLEQLPQAEQGCAKLRDQQAQLSRFCNDALVASMRMEHSAIAQRVENLKAALHTWQDYLRKIALLSRNFNEKVQKIKKGFHTVQAIIAATSAQLPQTGSEADLCLSELREQRKALTQLTPELEAVNVMEEELKECVSPADMKSIRQTVWILWQQEADLDNQLALLINRIEDRLTLKSTFDSKHDRLMQWMDSVEDRLDNESHNSVSDPEEILRRLEKEVQSEIVSREREKEWLLSCGHELLTFYDAESANDQRNRNEIQAKIDLTIDSWERLKLLCKSRSSKIHDLKLTMLRLEERIAAIRAWLYQMEVGLSRPLVFASTSNEAFEKLIQEHEKHQRAIEKESSNVGEVLNLCEMLLSDVDTWKAHFNTNALTNSVQSLERRWKNVCTLSATRKRKIHNIWTLLLEIVSLTSDQELWVERQEQDLAELEKGLEHLTTVQVQTRIEALEKKIKEFEQRAMTFRTLNQTFSRLLKSEGLDPDNVQELTSSTKDILNRYNALTPHALDIIGKLNMDLKFYRDFINTHGKAVVALTHIDVELTKVQHLTKPQPEEQLKSVQALEQELKICESDLAHADKLGLVIMKNAKPEDIDTTQALIDEYQSLWKDISSRLVILKTELTTTITKLRTVRETAEIQKRTFETDSAVQVNTLPSLNRQTSITAKDAYMLELEAALKESRANLDELEKQVNDPARKPGSQVVAKAIASCQSSVELLNHLSTILITECFATDEEASVGEVADITSHYETLISMWRAKERQQQDNRYGRATNCPNLIGLRLLPSNMLLSLFSSLIYRILTLSIPHDAPKHPNDWRLTRF